MPQKIGPCKFSALPEYYQKMYLSGTLVSTDLFFQCKIPSNAIFSAVFFSMVYIIPCLFIIYSGVYTAFQNPELLLRISQDLSSSVVFFLVGLSIFGVVIWGIYFMLKMGWFSLMRAYSSFHINTKIVGDKQYYGLLLDEKNLVLRHGEYFDDSTCAYIPKDSIKDLDVSKIKVWFPKRSYHINVVKVKFVNENQENQELILKERFNLTAYQMQNQIQQWL